MSYKDELRELRKFHCPQISKMSPAAMAAEVHRLRNAAAATQGLPSGAEVMRRSAMEKEESKKRAAEHKKKLAELKAAKPQKTAEKKKREPTAWNKFVSEKSGEGLDMMDIAAMWRQKKLEKK